MKIPSRYIKLFLNRSSYRRCSVKKVLLKNFTKFTGKHLYQSLFFNKVAGLRPATLLKKRLWHRCFPVNFVKFLRTSFLHNTSGRLFLSKPNDIEATCSDLVSYAYFVDKEFVMKIKESRINWY